MNNVGLVERVHWGGVDDQDLSHGLGPFPYGWCAATPTLLRRSGLPRWYRRVTWLPWCKVYEPKTPGGLLHPR